MKVKIERYERWPDYGMITENSDSFSARYHPGPEIEMSDEEVKLVQEADALYDQAQEMLSLKWAEANRKEMNK